MTHEDLEELEYQDALDAAEAKGEAYFTREQFRAMFPAKPIVEEPPTCDEEIPF